MNGKSQISKKILVKRHSDLEVYRKAFAAAMRVFELSKAFPREEIFSLTDQMRAHHVPSVRILLKHGERDVTLRHSLANSANAKGKRQKPKRGFNLPLNAVISIEKALVNFISTTMPSSACSSL